MKTFFELSKQLVEAKDEFKPHKMYDPKTGEAYDADTEADHLKYKKWVTPMKNLMSKKQCLLKKRQLMQKP